jgi:hypothetical protein
MPIERVPKAIADMLKRVPGVVAKAINWAKLFSGYQKFDQRLAISSRFGFITPD